METSKTMLEWLNELPEPYKTKAINNTHKRLQQMQILNMKHAIGSAFMWANTDERYDYWKQIFKIYEQP